MNIAIGFAITYTANILVLPFLWHPDKPLASAFWIGCVFTVISQVRQLVIRRYFNGIKFGNREAKAGACSPRTQPSARNTRSTRASSNTFRQPSPRLPGTAIWATRSTTPAKRCTMTAPSPATNRTHWPVT